MSMPSTVKVTNGPTTPRKMSSGSIAMIAFQSGVMNSAVTSRILVQMSSRASMIVTRKS